MTTLDGLKAAHKWADVATTMEMQGDAKAAAEHYITAMEVMCKALNSHNYDTPEFKSYLLFQAREKLTQYRDRAMLLMSVANHEAASGGKRPPSPLPPPQPLTAPPAPPPNVPPALGMPPTQLYFVNSGGEAPVNPSHDASSAQGEVPPVGEQEANDSFDKLYKQFLGEH